MSDKEKQQLEQFKAKHPELFLDSQQHADAIKQQSILPNVKRPEVDELALQKKAAKIHGYSKKKQKTLDDPDLTDEEREQLLRIKENWKEHCSKIDALPKNIRYVSKKASYDLMDAETAKKEMYNNVILPKLKGNEFVLNGYEAAIKGVSKIDYKQLWHQLTLYIIRSKDCMLDLNKGLCLIGDVGVGKSFIMECLSEFTQKYDKLEPVRFSVASCKDDIVMKLRSDKDFALVNSYINGQWCYDDLGKESNEVKIFGNSDCVMASILDTQHKKFKATGKLTHATTNVTVKNLPSLYGDRVADRMNEAYNFIYLQGQSRRK